MCEAALIIEDQDERCSHLKIFRHLCQHLGPAVRWRDSFDDQFGWPSREGYSGILRSILHVDLKSTPRLALQVFDKPVHPGVFAVFLDDVAKSEPWWPIWPQKAILPASEPSMTLD